MKPVTDETTWTFELATMCVRRDDTGEEFDPNDLLPHTIHGHSPELMLPEPFTGNRESNNYAQWVARVLNRLWTWFDLVDRQMRDQGIMDRTFFVDPTSLSWRTDTDLEPLSPHPQPTSKQLDRMRERQIEFLCQWWGDTVASPKSFMRMVSGGNPQNKFGLKRVASIATVTFKAETCRF